jgi:hypothetical protein
MLPNRHSLFSPISDLYALNISVSTLSRFFVDQFIKWQNYHFCDSSELHHELINEALLNSTYVS